MKILVVRRDNIGDLVCTTPLLAMLKRALPEAEIDVLANSYNAPVLDRNPDVGRVWVYTKMKHRTGAESGIGTLARSFAMYRAILARNYDWAILAGGVCTRQMVEAGRRTGAQRLIAYRPADPHDAERVTMRVEPPNAPRHEAIDCAELGRTLLTALGRGDRAGEPGALKIFPDSLIADALRFAAGLGPGMRPVVAIVLGAREPDRRWPKESFRALIDGLRERVPGSVPMLLWPPAVVGAAAGHDEDMLAGALLLETGVVGISTPTLPDLVAALSIADLVVSADGGAVHIAAALGKPVVALFENRPEKFLRWYPWKARSRVVISPGRAIAEIPAVDVCDAAVALCGTR